ncbi:NAD(P)-dependent oxidoreductase [Neoactinobaculum massilliense]|uniref:NAD(P)-dependent oxidoreductase n=1 Tax=Neoactinobaculum massilliense TaxID=2364794 RepID=UPI000F52A02C|nr:NAD(P)-dependent oxidoreductase [Neoactinobaculum massilliense]
MHVALYSQRDDERAAIAQFKAAHPDLEIDVYDQPLTEDLRGTLKGIDAVVVQQIAPMGEETYAEMERQGVKALATRSAGTDMYRLDLLKKHGVKMVNVPSYSPESIAEFAFVTALTVSRKAAPFIERRAENHDFSWEPSMMSRTIRSKTIGIAGTGRIGRETARFFAGIGCKVLGYDLYPSDAGRELLTYVDSLDDLLRQSDIVSFHMPATAENHHILDARAIALMPEGAIVVNTGRGALIDTEALLDAVDSGHLAGAALDVYEFEDSLVQKNQPEVDSLMQRILDNPRVLYTPHIAFYTEQAVAALIAQSIEGAIEAAQGGHPVGEIEL